MQEFYAKKDKKPRVPQLSKKPKSNVKEPSMPTFTVEEMMRTVNEDTDITNPNYDFNTIVDNKNNRTSGTGGQPKRIPLHKRDYHKKKTDSDSNKKNTNKNQKTKKKNSNQNTMLSSTKKDPELMMMKYDLKDYKRRVTNNDDLRDFEKFLNDDMDDDDDGYGDNMYMNQNSQKEKKMDRELYRKRQAAGGGIPAGSIASHEKNWNETEASLFASFAWQ